MVPDLPPVLTHDLVPDMVPDLQPDMVPDLQPVFCNNFVIKHGIRYASSSVARSVTRRGARSCIISPDLPPIGTQGAENTSQHAELKLTLLFAEIIAKSMPSNRCAFRSLAAQVYRLPPMPPTSLSGMGPMNLGGSRGPWGPKLRFSMFWALGIPPGTQEGQNYTFQAGQLHFDLV